LKTRGHLEACEPLTNEGHGLPNDGVDQLAESRDVKGQPFGTLVPKLYVTYLHQSKISEWLSSVRRTLTMAPDQSH
jgi:hypothetical protein